MDVLDVLESSSGNHGEEEKRFIMNFVMEHALRNSWELSPLLSGTCQNDTGKKAYRQIHHTKSSCDC
eukprot:scaffold43032_cov50-Attheya_sp.AAC.1